MSQILCILVSLALIWPVAYQGFAIGGKPVDFVASDMIPLALIFCLGGAIQLRGATSLRLQASYRLAVLWSFAFVGCCLTLALVGYTVSGESVRVASALKFVKPVCFFTVGYIMARRLGTSQFLQILVRACLAMTLLSGFSTLIDPAFPNGAWGKKLLGFDLYGYPNSPMTFYGCLVPFLLAGARFETRTFLRPLYYVAPVIMLGTIAGSMSRSSAGVAICGAVIFFCLTRNTRALSAIALCGLCVAAFGLSLEHWAQEYEAIASLKERVEIRLERTLESDDALSGRGEIWIETAKLAAARPFFGYCFESFSNYSYHSTPHQQYLEILFKAGGVGLVTFFIFFLYAAGLVAQLLRFFANDRMMGSITCAVAASLLAVCIGNMTQPNFTYSVTGNFQFFILGLLLSDSTIHMVQSLRAAEKAVVAPTVRRPTPESVQPENVAWEGFITRCRVNS